MTDYRALCAELVEAWYGTSDFDFNDFGHAAADIVTRARAVLAQPAPQGADLTACDLLERFIDCFWDEQDAESYPNAAALVAQARVLLAQPEPVAPTDEELLKLMPETMLDEFSYAAKVCSDATGGQVKPGIFRVSLNTGALDYARAVLARWGQP